MSFRLKSTLLIFLSSLSFISVSADDSICGTGAATIEVTGNGSVEVMPDLATVRFNVTSLEKNAKSSRDKTEGKASAFINSLKDLKLTEDNIIASSVTIYPVYDYSSNDKRVFLGYRTTRDITLKLTDFSFISDVVDLALKSGITEISGVSYSLKDSNKVQADADLKAINDAKDKASRFAKGFDTKLKHVCSIRPQAHENFARPFVKGSVRLLAADGANAQSADFTPEKVTVESSVTVVYSLDD
ncbi:MAG: SIMPL domain-containing protein [Succinivibrio sp.]